MEGKKNLTDNKDRALSGSKLWTKDFTIITVGSMISMLGNTMVAFSVSLFVLDSTESSTVFAFYVFLYTLPQILAPILAGPLMDRFSRRRTIYMLDFTSALIYMFGGLAILLNLYSFPLLALMTLVVGTINSVYAVAYSSFYPLLITKGYFSKAYSIASTLETLTFVMVPIATFLYKSFGIAPLLFVNGACFFMAALFETRISDVEAALKRSSVENVGDDTADWSAEDGDAEGCDVSDDAAKGNAVVGPETSYSFKKYITDTKDGIKYLFSEKALLLVAIYFTFSSFSGGASYVMTLPWFKESFNNGEYIYMTVSVFIMLGRMIGGFIHYKIKFPTHLKYTIALVVYISISLLEGFYLYTPLNVMRAACFIIGIMGVTSYNIRISATQSYVPNNWKGRFNGAFLMLNTVGSLLGELVAGTMASFMSMRMVISIIMCVCAVSAVVFIGGGKKHIAPLYNRQS